MQAIRQRYNTLAVAFYNLYRGSITNCSTTPYAVYAFRMAQTYFPKISYNNIYEPAYTRPTVKYNVPIVAGLVLFTLWASHKTVAEQ